MEVKTFDTILTELCDSFDELISPLKITRTNTNVIYLIFKAISKGFEVINNVCVTLSNKFDPASCEVEDLDSVASLVGTERLAGSASGLHIIVTNNGESAVTLLTGIYNYALDDDTTFVFEVLEDTEIASGSYITVIAMSENIGSFSVTAQDSIAVTSEQTIPTDLSFSCTDNSSLLGTEAESDLAFRKRILEGYTNQDSIVELQNKLRNLPYLFDCRIKFNNTTENITFDEVTVPPFTACIFYSGAVRSEIAEVIADKLICPTVQTADSVAVVYESDVFLNNGFTYYLIPFAKEQFSVQVKYKIVDQYISDYDAKEEIRKALVKNYVAEVHRDYVKESDIYNIISALNIAGIEILDVNLYQNGTEVSYVEVPLSRIPELDEINFVNVGA